MKHFHTAAASGEPVVQLQKIKLSVLLNAGDYEIIASRCPQLRDLDVDTRTVGDAALLVPAVG
jgi:hypothetical protein